jgi:hypothetical protein
MAGGLRRRFALLWLCRVSVRFDCRPAFGPADLFGPATIYTRWAMAALPGSDIVEKGIADLSSGIESVEALLVSIGAPRLRRIGMTVPAAFNSPEHRLYELLARSGPDSAHARYNALVRRLVSFERAAECAR